MSRSISSRKSLRDFFHVIFKRKLQILLFFLITVCVVSVVTFMTEPIYEAISQIETFYTVSDSGGMNSYSIIGIEQEKEISSSIEILTSLNLANQVAKELGPSAIYKNMNKKAKGNLEGAQQMAADQKTFLEKAGWQLQRDLKAEGGKKSSIIKVKFRHPDRYVATTVVNKLVTLYFDRYLSKGEGRNISGTLTVDKAGKRIRVRPARTPLKPVKPKVMVNLILAIFAGFLGAFVLAFVREYLDDSLEKPEDILDTLELPVLAYIPEKNKITDEIIENIDKPEARGSKGKERFNNISFSPNSKWILVACLIIIAGVTISYRGLIIKRGETIETFPQNTENVFSAKINRNAAKKEENTVGGQKNLMQSNAKADAFESKSGVPPPLKVEQTSSTENYMSAKQRDWFPALGPQQDANNINTEKSLKEEVIERSSADTTVAVKAKATAQTVGLPEGAEKNPGSSTRKNESEDDNFHALQSLKEKTVEDTKRLPEALEKENDLALTQEPNDYFIQVGAFAKINMAEIASNNLRKKGFTPHLLENDTKKNTKIYRVRVRFKAQEIAPRQALDRLKKLGY